MQKNKQATQPLKVSLHGMNDRMLMMMTRFIELNCKDVADVVEEYESNVEIIDLDMVDSESILEQRLAQQPLKPIIALSLQKVSVEHVLVVEKPVDKVNVVNALKVIKRDLQKKQASLQKDVAVKAKDRSEYILNKRSEKKEIKETNKRSSYSAELARLQKERMRQKENAAKAFNSPNLEFVLDKKEVKEIEETSESTPIAEKSDEYSEIKESSEPINVASKKEPAVIKNTGEADVVSAPLVTEKNKEFFEIQESRQLKKSKGPKQNVSTQKKSVKPVEPDLKTELKKPLKNDLPVKENKATDSKNGTGSASVHNEEIDKLLKELSFVSNKPSTPAPKSEGFKQRDNRNFVRYAFHPLEVRLKKNSFTTITALLINTSSRGALIEVKKSMKLRGKVKLIIKYDSQYVFEISARIARKEGLNRYGLQFSEHQHELTDYLVNSGRPFYFA